MPGARLVGRGGGGGKEVGSAKNGAYLISTWNKLSLFLAFVSGYCYKYFWHVLECFGFTVCGTFHYPEGSKQVVALTIASD